MATGWFRIAPELTFILAIVSNAEVAKTDISFWLFVKIFIGIMFLILAIIVLNLSQVYLNLFTHFDCIHINISSRSIRVLVLVSFKTRAKIYLGRPT